MYDLIFKYFPALTEKQRQQIISLKGLYDYWNSMINVISRKDDDFYVHHVLHSLSIAKFITFRCGTRVLDVGTGGGFPGIPLAILFPETDFFLLDSTAKKIKVVTEIAKELKINNIHPICSRVEDEKDHFDFITSRGVTHFQKLIGLTSKNLSNKHINSIPNGHIMLKGGDIAQELGDSLNRASIVNISDFFEEPFFETKKIIYYSTRFYADE